MTVCAAMANTQRKGRRQSIPEHSLMPMVISWWVDGDGGWTQKPGAFLF